MSKFLRTCERNELNELAKTVIEKMKAAEGEFSTRCTELQKRLDDGEITKSFYADKHAEAVQNFEGTRRTLRNLYLPRFEALARKLRTLADAVKAPEITDAERNAVTLIQAMQQPTQAAINAAADAWTGNPITGEILRGIAGENGLQFSGKPRTDHLTPADIAEIADEIETAAKLYFGSHAEYMPESYGSHWDTLKRHDYAINNVNAHRSEQYMREMSNYNPFTFGESSMKLVEFDNLCDTTEI